MRRLWILPACAALAALALALAPATPGAPADPRLRSVKTWALPLGEGALANVLRRPGAFDLVVVDGEETTAAQVRRLRRHGAIVLGYLSVGTIERYRWWYGAASPYRLELWGDWGEWYADVSRRGFRDLIARRVARGPEAALPPFDPEHEALAETATDPLELAALLESGGLTDRRVREGQGLENVFAYARELFAATGRRSVKAARPASD